MIKEFINFIKDYLKTNIPIVDSSFNKLDTFNAYEPEHTPKAPEIDVLLVNSGEDSASNSFESENISTVSLSLYCYINAMKLDDDEDKTSVVDVGLRLMDDIKKVMDKNTISRSNQNIISCTLGSSSSTTKVENYNFYYFVLRYDFKINNNYV